MVCVGARHARGTSACIGERAGLIRAGLAAETDIETLTPERKPELVPWSRVFASREVLAVTLSYFSFGYVAWIFFSWFYIYLAQVRGLNLKASACYAMLPFLAMAVGCAVGGAVSDRLTRSHGPRLGRCVLAAVVWSAPASFLCWVRRWRVRGWPASYSRAGRALFISRKVRSGLSLRTSPAALPVRCPDS